MNCKIDRPVRAMAFCAVLCLFYAAAARAAGISTHSFTTCNLPDTAQAVSYTAIFGEDHDYSSSVSTPSFTVYSRIGSMVTVDNRTGLMWVTDPGGAGISGTFSWEGALLACETNIGAAGTYAGYSDWRLPNLKEFMSIVDYGRSGPSINPLYFLNTQSNAYWTATTTVPGTTYAWQLDFNTGAFTSADKASSSGYVRCVRGGP